MIKLTKLNKYYNKGKSNELHVVKDLNIEFAETGLVVFFGPSGCGKTTLLNIIGCLDTFNSGSISFLDQTFDRYKASSFDELRNHLIGYIFQNYNLVESKSVYDNVKVPLEMLGITSKEEMNKRIEYALNAVGMLKYRRRNVMALSGGQRQRVAIARAIAKNPKVIIADEPTGNLDSDNTFEVMNIIKKISKERLVILVSHEKNLVDYYADRIIELKDGMVVSDQENSEYRDLNHSDTRNIYLKDYKHSEINDNKVKLNIFDDEKNPQNAELDIIFKDGQVYIKEKSNLKVHYIEGLSEIKLLDAKEEDYKKKIINNVSTFSLDELGSVQEKSSKKAYINIFTSIKDGFSSKKRFSKRSKFTYIALIFASFVFASVLTQINSIFDFDRTDYLQASSNTVIVNLERKDKNSGFTTDDIIKDAKEVSGFTNISPYYEGMYFNVDLSRFYQQQRGYSSNFSFYPLNRAHYSSELAKGSNTSLDGEIIISKWIADMILETKEAKNSDFETYDDLLDLNIQIYLKDQHEYIIKGVSTEDSPVIYFSNNDYLEFNDSFGYYSSSSSKVYIDTKDKEKMKEVLSDKYSSVLDADKDGKATYIKSIFEDFMSNIIFLVVIALGLFIYLALMIRASMFKKIKDIGTLRSIGARKKDIISIFAGEMISLTTVTSFVGFTLDYLFLYYINSKFGLSELGLSLGVTTLPTYLLGVLLIYAFNIFAGILPALTLVRKTPVEIIKKYDI